MKVHWKKIWKKVPGIIRHDFIRKLIAVILAAIVYFAVDKQVPPDSDSGNELPYELVHLKVPDRFTLKEKKNSKIHLVRTDGAGSVELRLQIRKSLLSFGDSSNYSFIKKNAFRKRYHKGYPYEITISKDMILPPFGVTIVSVSPVKISYEAIAEKSVKVNPVLEKKDLLPDYIVKQCESVPGEVTITGPESILGTLMEVRTKPVPLKDITQSFSYSVDIDVPDFRLRISPGKVLLNVSITKNVMEREFKQQQIRVMNDSSRFMFEFIGPRYVNVKVKGVKDRIVSLKPDQIKPYIDITHLTSPGIYSVELGCWVMNNSAEVTGIDPSTVKVKITRK